MNRSLDFKYGVDWDYVDLCNEWPNLPTAIDEADQMAEDALNHDVINPIPPPALRLERIA